MQKILRIGAGIGVVSLVMAAAYLATMDCRIVLYVWDNCMWMRLQSYLALPDSRFLRMIVMECVGISLALILWLTYRYVFPHRKASPNASSPAPVAPETPRD